MYRIYMNRKEDLYMKRIALAVKSALGLVASTTGARREARRRRRRGTAAHGFVSRVVGHVLRCARQTTVGRA